MALVMSQMPDVWRKVLAEHVPDQSQRCRECRDTAGLQASWPCQTYRVAQEAKWVSEGNLPGTGPHGPGPSATPRLSRLDSSGFRSPAPRQGGYGLPDGSYGSDPYGAGPSRSAHDSGLGGSFVSGDGGYGSARGESGGTYVSRGSGGGMYGAEPTGSGSYGGDPYSSDPYGSGSYGSGSYGSGSYGSDPYSSDPYRSGSYGSSSYGSGSSGPSSKYGGSYSSGSFGSDSYGSGSHREPSSVYGSGSYGSDPYSSGSHRSDSHGAGGYGAGGGRGADDLGYGSSSGRSRTGDDSPPYGSRFDAPYGASFGVDDRPGPSWR